MDSGHHGQRRWSCGAIGKRCRAGASEAGIQSCAGPIARGWRSALVPGIFRLLAGARRFVLARYDGRPPRQTPAAQWRDRMMRGVLAGARRHDRVPRRRRGRVRARHGIPVRPFRPDLLARQPRGHASATGQPGVASETHESAWVCSVRPGMVTFHAEWRTLPGHLLRISELRPVCLGGACGAKRPARYSGTSWDPFPISASSRFGEVDFDPAMIARSPFLGCVERTYRQRAGEFRRGEHVIQLACCRHWRLLDGMKGGDIPAVPRQFVRPGIGLPAVRMFRPDAGESHNLHPVKHGLVAGGPVVVAVFAVAAQDVQIAGRQNAVPVLIRDERGQVGNDAVSGAVRDDKAVSRPNVRVDPLSIHRDGHQGIA